MNNFAKKINNIEINFSNHAITRWQERTKSTSLKPLELLLEDPKIENGAPEWCDINTHHQKVVHHSIFVDDESCFIVNKNPNGDFVAVTFIDKLS